MELVAKLRAMPRTARASAGNYCYHVLNRGNARQTVFHKPEDYAAFLRGEKGTFYFFKMELVAKLRAMPRTARASAGNYCYHVLNRGNARQTVFHKPEDYAAFLKLMAESAERVKGVSMRIIGYCLMPNHFHLVLWPRADGDLSRWMQWLLTSHVRRYHRHYGGSGHVWQGRFKAFPIQQDEHLLTVLRYIERNPVRAKTLGVRKAQRWPWSSVGTPPADVAQPPLVRGPVPRGPGWLEWVNAPLTEAELTTVRQSISRGTPFGTQRWQRTVARELGLESSMRPRGRPRKSPEK